MLFESLLELDAHIDNPVKLAVPLIVIIQIYGLFYNDTAGLFIGQLAPIQCSTNVCFNFIFVLKQLLVNGFVIADVQFHRNSVEVLQRQKIQME